MLQLEQIARDALEEARSALALIPEGERADAEMMFRLCELHFKEGKPLDQRREAARLVEILARRSAAALPFAALGRALLASSGGEPKQAQELLGEFRFKLSLLGL
jgi:hypothetical protein